MAKVQDTKFWYAAMSDKGKVRAYNEDTYLARPDLGLWLVADGMGGHNNGKQASEMACAAIAEKVSLGEPLKNAIEYAHQIVKQTGMFSANSRGMGTTIVALLLHKDLAEICWVGDSRAYYGENNSLTQITQDHSLVQRLIEAGQITNDQALVHPQRHIITQSLGMTSVSSLDIGQRRIITPMNKVFLLCSDGLNSCLSDKELLSMMASNEDPQHIVERMIVAANNNLGRDNITVLLVGAR